MWGVTETSFELLQVKIFTLLLQEVGIRVRIWIGYPDPDIHPKGRYRDIYQSNYQGI